MLNNVSLMGRLTAYPEIRHTTSGTAVCSFTLASDNQGKDKGASFIPCVAWDKTAEFVGRYFGKGSMLAIDGRLQTRAYEDRDGKKHTVMEVVVAHVHFCERKADVEKVSAPVTLNELVDEDECELPF